MPSSYKLGELLDYVEASLADSHLYYGHGTDNAHDEAAYLVLGGLRLGFDIDEESLDQTLDNHDIAHIKELLRQRIDEHIPVAYLLNEAWFAGLPFYVDERVLIPRSPIAELIESRFTPWLKEERVKSILDIGTGSGCIAVASALAFPAAQVDAIDISADALLVAEKNVSKHKVEAQVQLIQSDLYESLTTQKYDLIIANPPYVSIDEVAELAEEYQHEPTLGLEAGVDGMDIVRRLIKQSEQHLEKEGILVVEVGQSQEAFNIAFPDLPVTWLEFEYGGEGVFLVTSSELASL